MEDFKIEVFRDEEIDYRKLGKLLYRGFFIVEKDKKFVITDEFFNVITKGMFDEIKPAFRYHFWGRMNEHWKLYNMVNHTVGQYAFKFVDTFILDFANVSIDGTAFGFCDRKGNFVIEAQYGAGAYLGMNYFLISKGNEFAVIDRNENFIIPFSCGDVPTFSTVIQQILKNKKPLKEWLKL